MTGAVHPSWAVYDLDRLASNLAEVQRRVGPGQNIFAATKGNAYGHGALPVARALERGGVTALMTGSYEEASLLRANGVCLPVVMFAGALPEGIGELTAAGLIPTIVDMAGAMAAAAKADDTPVQIYVKADMGLGRLGVVMDEIEGFLGALSAMPGLQVAGLYTHLPFGDQAGCEWARTRFAAFDDLLVRLERAGLLPPVTQAGASSSVAAGLTDQGNAVCVGHLLFGLSPFAGEPVGDLSAFRPVLCEVGTQLVQVTEHRQGHDLAIAGAFGIREGKRIGVAPMGVANGLQRPIPGSTPCAIIKGQRVPVIAVSLEHLTLDLDEVGDAQVSDEVLLLGGQGAEAISLEELAGWFGLPCLDTVMALSQRLDARYRGDACKEVML